MAAAESVLGGVLQKNGDKLPDKTQDILQSVRDKLSSNPGKDPTQPINGKGVAQPPGKDTLAGGADTLAGGGKASDASLNLTKLGSVKLPDLSSVKAAGSVAPMDLPLAPSAASAADAALVKAAPAVQVDLTLVGQSIDLLTKKMGKLGGGG